MTDISEGSGHQELNVRASALLNHALRLEYAAIIHLERLALALQSDDLRRRLSLLSADSISQATKTAAVIRELGGSPVWQLWTPHDSSGVRRMLEAQLDREMICGNLYTRAAELLKGHPLEERCAALVSENARHAEMVEQALSQLTDGDCTPSHRVATASMHGS
jgi:bacterioferritin (cytochrome b1)